MARTLDQKQAERAQQGDLEAYGELVEAYQSSVFSVCYRVLGNRRDAEDLTQEAFLRAHQKLDTFQTDRPFGPWIRTLAANLCYNFLQRKRLERVPLQDEWDQPDDLPRRGPETALELTEDQERLYQALWSLPDHHRLALELRHFQGLSYQEMAQALDLPLNTVRSHLYRGRKKLAELLETYD